MIKKTGFIICKHLVHLVNKSFKDGKFPSILKQAKTVPLHKAGAKYEINNYRPISLLTAWSKVFDRVMYNRIYTYFETFGLFHPNQFGFRKKDSTIDAIAKLTETVHESRNCQVATFFIDLRKAFDTVDHQILLQKLKLYGIRGVCLRWFSDYLSKRQPCISVNNCNSSWLKLNCGVPQGSILGPLFLIYINDLPDVCQVFRTFLFADDTNLTAVNSDFESKQKDLVNVEKWLNANKLSLNPEKSCQMNIKIRNNASNVNKFSIFKLNSVYIPESESCKYLGLRLVKN